MVRIVRIRENERGLVFRNREFSGMLKPGRHFFFDPLMRVRIERVSVRDTWLRHPELDVIVKSGALAGEVRVLDLSESDRAIVFVNGRFESVLKPGLYAAWTAFNRVEVEVVKTAEVRFSSRQLPAILESPTGRALLEAVNVEPGQCGLFFRDGKLEANLSPGQYAYWKGVARVRAVIVDLREQVVDISGQEIMTSDKVTLRLNALVTYRIEDALAAVTMVDDYRQALYRESQLALRAAIGTRDLDSLLSEKDKLAAELTDYIRGKVKAFGLAVSELGIRDVILPGEMKDLLNKVTEAKKAAEAALITRREETAAMRSQANTARVFEGNPVLMRLRELEVLEKIAANTKLSIVLGEKGLRDRIVNLV